MPVQEIFLEQLAGDDRVQVLKTYDQTLAKEAFDLMDPPALAFLGKSLGIKESYEPNDIPNDASDFGDFLWVELLDSSREEGQIRSFFVVRRSSPRGESLLYVSGDWPSAEAFARGLLAH
jgi:hypothetical protein